jgi:multiple sugar transport system ATP-binding protein
MIYVTHDQVEAMTLADKIVVLDQGEVQQVGSPLELYHKPANLFVAGFIGSPKMNHLPVRLAAYHETGIEVTSHDLARTRVPVGPVQLPESSSLVLGLRPQAFQIVAPESAPLVADVMLVEHLGNETILKARLPSREILLVVAPGDSALLPGARIGLSFDPTSAHLVAGSGPRIGADWTDDAPRA